MQPATRARTLAFVDGYDVTVRVARLALASSAEGVGFVEDSVRRTAAAYGLDVAMVVLPEQVVLQDAASHPGRVTVVRAAPGIFRLDQVTALGRVLEQVEAGLSAAEACGLLDRVARRGPLWPWWARVVGVALFAAGFAPSVVATWDEVAAATVLGLLMGIVVVGAGGTRLEGFVPFVGAFVVTLAGLTLLPGMASTSGVALLVLPALFVTVPGDTLSAAAGELLTGRLTAGAVRLVLAFFVLGLVVVGVVAAAQVTDRTDLLSETLPTAELAYGTVLVGWVVFSVGLVLTFNAEPRVLLWLVPSVVGTFVLQQGSTRVVGAVLGTVVAGIVLGAFAHLAAARPHRPPRLVLVLGGFFVLTVGGLGVRGVTALLGGDAASSVHDLADFGLQIPTVALAIALGVVLADAAAEARGRLVRHG